MRGVAFLLPEPFTPHRFQFCVRAATGSDTLQCARGLNTYIEERRAQSLQNAKHDDAHALFAKPDASRTNISSSPSTSKNPRKDYAFKRRTPALVKRTKDGMCVALPRVVMLLSELAIIYLATAAPFGVSRFFSQNAQGVRGLRALLRSAAVSLAWPLTALRLLLKKAKALVNDSDEVDESNAPEVERVVRVKRAAVNSLRAFEDALVVVRGLDCETERHALFAARAAVERYAGLALACAGLSTDAQPTARELELCRIAGRAGDDLLVAGRCFHRRNVTRLLAHRERASAELVHALADACEVAHAIHSTPRQFNSAEQTGGDHVKEIYGPLLQTLSRAIELLSLFDDRATVVSVARLLDAECARLRRLEARTRTKEGGGQCTTQAVHTAFAMPPRPTTRSQGG
jgi:hypothetical protein